MKYRAEIDGLRAIAVISVILYHAGFKAFSGGYVGVDVFFVISGYLITTIILSELEMGTFSLTHFYERRARRILPMLFFVMFTCIPFAYFLLPPGDMTAFSASLVSVSAFASNILFWKTSGYFDTATELKPLIHTWSLAVEEQWYLLFPLFLILSWKFCRSWTVRLFTILFILSLALAQRLSVTDPNFAFYMLPTRCWELLIGTFIALYFTKHDISKNNKHIEQPASLIGLFLIMYPVFTYDSHPPPFFFPGIYAIIPTLGAALIIIFATHKTIVGKLIGSKLFVAIGLISYSAYLWHQPIFSFIRAYSFDEPRKYLISALTLIIFGFAYLSWKYIEKPFRNKHQISSNKIFLLSAICSLIIIGIGLKGIEDQLLSLYQITNCNSAIKVYGDADCKVRGSGNRIIVVWGDSHASVLSKTIPEIHGYKIYVISHPGCPPIIGVRRFDGLGNSVKCNNINTLVKYTQFIESLKPETVILVGRWTMYLNGFHSNGIPHIQHHFLSISNDDNAIKPLLIRQTMLKDQLHNTVDYLSKHSNVILLSQTPDYALFSLKKIQASNFNYPLSSLLAYHKEELEVLQSFNNLSPRVKVLDIKKLFCNREVCTTRNNGTLLYTDDNHLTYDGSRKEWKMITDEISLIKN